MPKKNAKNNEITLLNDIQLESMTIKQLELELETANKELEAFASKGKYSQAEICTKKIEQLKSALKQKEAKEISKRHYKEKKNLIQDKVSDIDNLSYLWDQRFQELQSKSQLALEELRRNQKDELQQLLSQYKQSSYDVRPSREYLSLQKEEEGLVKLRKFKEAEVIRKRKENQKKIDEKKNVKIMENTFKNYEKKLRQKHLNELQYLQNKFQAEFDELNKEKLKDMEFLDKKYSVKSKDLVNQQKREDTIHKFKNYGNRIGGLSNNYEIKYTLGQKEYKPPEKMENVERIQAELNNDNKFVEDEKEIESEKTPNREGMNQNKEKMVEIESDKIKDNSNEENEEKDHLKDVEFPEYEN